MNTLMRRLLLPVCAGGALLMASSAAFARVDFSVNLGAPGYYAPPPVYVAPPPVYYAPPPPPPPPRVVYYDPYGRPLPPPPDWRYRHGPPPGYYWHDHEHYRGW